MAGRGDSPRPPAERDAHARDDAPPTLLRRYVRALSRYRALVVLFWLAVLGVGMFGLINVFGSLKGEARPYFGRRPLWSWPCAGRRASRARRPQIKAIPGDANDVAGAAMTRAFGTRATSDMTVLMVSANGSPVVVLPQARAVAAAVSAFAAPYIQQGLLTSDRRVKATAAPRRAC